MERPVCAGLWDVVFEVWHQKNVPGLNYINIIRHAPFGLIWKPVIFIVGGQTSPLTEQQLVKLQLRRIIKKV